LEIRKPSAVRARQALREVVPLVVLVVAAAAYLAPALSHGIALGPYDILSTTGLTARAHAHVHNLIGSDEIEEFIPWQVLSWREVHAGHLPLWDPYSLLGLPLAFNFQSAPFSLPVVISYLFPLRLAHDAAIVSRLVLGGAGAYVLGRTLSCSRVAASFAGIVYELSGAFTIWLGAYEAGVYCFLGWILAASVLLARGRHRSRDIALVALSLALALYAGEPQIALFVILALVVMATTLGLFEARARRSWRPLGRCARDHGLAILAGVALAAPLYLPGIQLALSSARSTGPYISGLPLYDLTHLVFATYNGTPTAQASIIGPDNLYVSMLYVGVVPVVLAALGLIEARRQGGVAALAVLSAIVLIALFASPVVDLARAIPAVKVFRLLLGTPVVDFGLAMLAGVGMDVAISSKGRAPAARRVLLGATILAAAALGLLGARLGWNVSHLSATQAAQRARSFAWPGAGVLVLGGVVVAARRSSRRPGAHGRALGLLRPVGVAALFLVSAGFLIDAGAGIWSSTKRPFASTPALSSLLSKVGSALVGIGSCATNSLPSLGVVPNANLAYGLHELAGFDPIVPKAYAASYGAATQTSQAVKAPPALFCPAITTVALARSFGVRYILEPQGAAGPPGTIEVARPGGEGLFLVPGSSRASLLVASRTPRPRRIALFARELSPSSFEIAFDAPTRASLELALTAVPGWHASLDGRPLALALHDKIELSASVPAGHHIVRLTYWPALFSLGLVCGGLSGIGLVLGWGIATWRRRSSSKTTKVHARGEAHSEATASPQVVGS
jgi:hypothetical protein